MKKFEEICVQWHCTKITSNVLYLQRLFFHLLEFDYVKMEMMMVHMLLVLDPKHWVN